MNTLFTSYIYIYLNPLRAGEFAWGRLKFSHEPFYVGKGSNSGRIDVHLRGPGNNNHKKNLIAKIKRSGLEPIRFKLYEGITECSANRLERYYIAKIGRADRRQGPLTNMTDGGEGVLGYRHTENTIQKIKEHSIKYWSNIENHIKSSNYFKGENNPFYQKTHTEENKLKFSMKAKETFTGKKQTETHKNKKADAIKGDKNGMYGKNLLDVWIEKHGVDEAMLKYVKHISDTRTGQNNSQYGKFGINHPAGKKRVLTLPDNTVLEFKSVDTLKDFLEQRNIKYNTLRQYSRKGSGYMGYFLASV
jgi:hypothetical protein